MKEKSKAGRPKLDNPKIRSTFRLSQDVDMIIKSQPNQAKYIESLVRNDKLKPL